MADTKAPVPAQPESGTAPATANTSSIWSKAGDRIVTFFDKPYASAAHRRLEDRERAAKEAKEKALEGGFFGVTLSRGDEMTMAGSPAPYSFPNPTPLTRPSSYSNRPSIQIISRRPDGSTQQAVPFTSFILHSVSGGDTEKVDVVETFGAPHVFSSGRFMRRYNFSGSTRVTVVNASATGDSTTVKGRRVSSYAMLQQFYEESLRCTLQAQRNQFTRITVDHEIFDGWILQYTPGRVSDSEGFATFSFSMVVFDRRFENKADLTDVLTQFSPTPAPKQRFIAAAATTELNHALGAGTFSLSNKRASAKGSKVSTGSSGLTLNLSPDVTCVVKDANCLVHATGPAGLTLSIAGKPVKSGGVLLAVGTHPVAITVTDPVAFITELKAGGQTSSTAVAAFTLDNKGSGAGKTSSTTLSATIDVELNVPVSLSGISVTLGTATVTGGPDGKLSLPAYVIPSSSTGSVSIPYSITVTLTGPDANLPNVQGLVLSVSGSRATANARGVTEQVATGGEDATVVSKIGPPTITGTPTSTTFTCTGTWSVPATNPFKQANIAELDVALAFVVPNRTTVVRSGISFSAQYAIPAQTRPILQYKLISAVNGLGGSAIALTVDGPTVGVLQHFAVSGVLEAQTLTPFPYINIGSKATVTSGTGEVLVVSPVSAGDGSIVIKVMSGADLAVEQYRIQEPYFLVSMSPLFAQPTKIQ